MGPKARGSSAEVTFQYPLALRCLADLIDAHIDDDSALLDHVASDVVGNADSSDDDVRLGSLIGVRVVWSGPKPTGPVEGYHETWAATRRI